MSDIEIATLKAEIVRLNKLITILIEQNEALKEQIAVANITNPSLNVGGAFAKVTNGNTEVPIAIAKITNGNTEIKLANANITDGNTNAGGAFANITNGNTEVPIAVAKVTNGNTNVPVGLPLLLSTDAFNVARLQHILKSEGFNKVRRQAVTNASKMLLHFYNRGGGGYPELRKLTGLSNFGMAKYIRSLKKRGLIERDGWQKFKLTTRALHLIQKAECTAPKGL